jgi:metallo-beta-lactamase family protein
MVEVLKNAIKRRAKIIAPAFSVGRTQEIVFLLNQIFDKGLVQRFPIYVDSPLSTNATQVFRLHPECFDFETSRFLVKEKDPFGFNKLTYITDVEDSKELNSIHGPMMIISASGMAESGRILHHLANNVQNPNNIILMTGYCAENTLGRRIIEKIPDIKIFGEEYYVTAEIVTFNSLSAHADSDELMDYVKQLDNK